MVGVNANRAPTAISQRRRVMWRFWLDVNKPEDAELNQFCEFATGKRQLSACIRDGLRLIGTLREGRLDVLLELFPFVRAEILMQAQGAAPVQTVAPTPGNAKKIAAPRFDLPTFNDDDLLDTLIVKKDTSTDSAANFLNSLAAFGL